ncbi:MAG: KpsF/GutQ family sugar-phosphate isomerase [Dongiaceae bacterium]
MTALSHSSSTLAPQGTSAAHQAAAKVLEIEAEGLLALRRSLDERFDRALDLLVGVTGRVVVTGMGKSGHVGRKIAATLASTGTPALYVHPAEASHGDLGMVAQGDAVIALSNSGGTAELADIIAYSRRFRIPLIAMTSRADSVLANAADQVLLLPRVVEACPMGLAPTTSTTMMLALGDAIAIALLSRRGFSPDDFQVLHPGGSLGRRLLRVADIMHRDGEVPLVPPDLSMDQAILVMTSKRFGCVGIVEGGKLVGIVTDGDLRRHMSPELLRCSAGEIMTRKPMTIRPDALAAEALAQMNLGDRPVTSLFVVERGNRPVGIVHVHDCLRAGVG